jgi:hypothetical protein
LKNLTEDEEKLSEEIKAVDNQQQKSNIDTSNVSYGALCDAVRLQECKKLEKIQQNWEQ